MLLGVLCSVLICRSQIQTCEQSILLRCGTLFYIISAALVDRMHVTIVLIILQCIRLNQLVVIIQLTGLLQN